MGLSIHYRGKIKEYAAIDMLVTEAEDVCSSMDWPCQVFDTRKSLLQPGESAESLVDRMEEILKKKFNSNNTHS